MCESHTAPSIPQWLVFVQCNLYNLPPVVCSVWKSHGCTENGMPVVGYLGYLLSGWCWSAKYPQSFARRLGFLICNLCNLPPVAGADVSARLSGWCAETFACTSPWYQIAVSETFQKAAPAPGVQWKYASGWCLLSFPLIWGCLLQSYYRKGYPNDNKESDSW